jgi:hypothetical protein
MRNIKMPFKEYWIKNKIIFHEKGQAINYCIKEDLPFHSIEEKWVKTVKEVEDETGVNYGCQPCDLLASGDCNGAKPGSFYYPHECPGFSNEDDENLLLQYEEELEQDWWKKSYGGY